MDLEQKWILSECDTSADCNFPGGTCLPNKATGRGFCSARCSGLCDYDKFGYPVTFCVENKQSPAEGFCTYKFSDFNDSCRPYAGFEPTPDVSRLRQPEVTADVCLPASS